MLLVIACENIAHTHDLPNEFFTRRFHPPTTPRATTKAMNFFSSKRVSKHWSTICLESTPTVHSSQHRLKKYSEQCRRTARKSTASWIPGRTRMKSQNTVCMQSAWVADDILTFFFLDPIPLSIIRGDWWFVVELKYPMAYYKMLQQTFAFALTASSILINIVQWPRCENGKLWRHRNGTVDKSCKRTEAWTLNRCWLGGCVDWFWHWHRHTSIFAYISASTSIDACRPFR